MNINSTFENSFKQFKFKSIFFKNLIFYATIVMIPIVVCTLFYYTETTRMVDSQIENSAKNELQRTHDVVDSLLNEMKNITYSTAINENVTIFTSSVNEDFNNEILWWRIKDRLDNLKTMYDYIDSVYVYSISQNCIIDNLKYNDFEKFYDKGWLEKYDTLSTEQTFLYLRDKNNNYPQLITILKPIYFNNIKKGVVVTNINIDKLGKKVGFLESSFNNYGMITDSDGEIYYSNQTNYVGTFFKDIIGKEHWESLKIKNNIGVTVNKEKYIANFLPSKVGALSYTSLFPKAKYQQKINDMILKSALLSLLFLMLGVGISFVMTSFSFSPIRKVMNYFEDNKEFLDSQISTTASDELKYITEYVAQLILSKEDMKTEMEKNAIDLRRAHNLALQSQINPHFLSNTLETINWKAIEICKGENIVSDMITDLGEIYEYVLNVNDYLVNVKDEIAYTKLYAKILKFRYKDKFDLEWNVNPEIENCKIIKLSLQPLLENAIYHGIKPKRTHSIVRISGIISDNNIIFSVYDDGIGISKAQLIEIENGLKKSFDIFDNHIGMANVNQRIKMVYGNEYGLEIKSKFGEFTEVIFKFPKKM